MPDDAEILLEETSPGGYLEAVVEQDERVAYLYLRAPENEEFGLKTCWLRNLRAAPDTLNVSEMREGLAPVNPRANCVYPEGQAPLKAEDLSLVWFPEGDAVAVLKRGDFLAAIPSWSGHGDFHGYARDAVGQGPLAWGLEEPEQFIGRIRKAQQYWAAWEADPNPWRIYQSKLLDYYESKLGPHSRYFAIDRDEWPPRALVLFERDECTYLVTVGLCLRPQPQVEMAFEDPSDHRRIELAAALSKSVDTASVMKLADYIGANADLPWCNFTFLGHGHTIPCNAFAEDRSLKDLGAVILTREPADAPFQLDLEIGGDPINLLWIIPITEKERTLAQATNSAALFEKFPGGAPSCRIQKRKSVLGLFR